MRLPEHYESDMLFFFEGRLGSLEPYQALMQMMEPAFPAASVRVQRSQISFYGRHLFAMVSLPRRRGEEGLVVSFGLPYRLSSPRISFLAEPYPGRWTHHLLLPAGAAPDGELLGWLREAWDFSESK